MSPKHDRDVLRLVEFYKRTCPGLERRFLRRLIRSEHPEIFGTKDNPELSKLKTLDRHLRQVFTNPVTVIPDSKPETTKQVAVNPPPRLGFWGYRKWSKEEEMRRIDEDIARRCCRIETSHAYMGLRTDDPEFHRKYEEIKERFRKKYGLPYFS